MFHRIDDGFVRFTWPALLETDKKNGPSARKPGSDSPDILSQGHHLFKTLIDSMTFHRNSGRVLLPSETGFALKVLLPLTRALETEHRSLVRVMEGPLG